MITKRNDGCGGPPSRGRGTPIRHRTCGRVDTLEVEVIGNRVIIRGRTTSYHLKQLAIQGVLDVLDANPDSALEMDMQVIVAAPVAEVELN